MTGNIARITFNSVQLRMYDTIPFTNQHHIHILPRQCGSSLFVKWYSLLLHNQNKKFKIFVHNHNMVRETINDMSKLVDINNDLNMNYNDMKNSVLSIGSNLSGMIDSNIDTIFFDNTLFTDPQQRKINDIIDLLLPFSSKATIHIINTPHVTLEPSIKRLNYNIVTY